MNLEEQSAFIDAYVFHVPSASRKTSEKILRLYLSEEKIDESLDYAPIMQALGIWHSAYMFALTRNKP